MTDFSPLLANPKSLLLGAAAQFGIFITFAGAASSGFFSAQQAAAIGIIGGADGPTAILVALKMAPELLGAIAVCAYSYMALIPIIQPPIMRLLTTEKERAIRMDPPRQVSKNEKILFPIVSAIVTVILLPSAASLIGHADDGKSAERERCDREIVGDGAECADQYCHHSSGTVGGSFCKGRSFPQKGDSFYSRSRNRSVRRRYGGRNSLRKDHESVQQKRRSIRSSVRQVYPRCRWQPV